MTEKFYITALIGPIGIGLTLARRWKNDSPDGWDVWGNEASGNIKLELRQSSKT